MYHKTNIWWVTRVFWKFATSLTKMQTRSSLFLRWLRNFGQFSALMPLDEMAESFHVRIQPKVFIESFTDDSVANIVFLAQFWHWLDWVCLYQFFQSFQKSFSSLSIHATAVEISLKFTINIKLGEGLINCCLCLKCALNNV